MRKHAEDSRFHACWHAVRVDMQCCSLFISICTGRISSILCRGGEESVFTDSASYLCGVAFQWVDQNRFSLQCNTSILCFTHRVVTVVTVVADRLNYSSYERFTLILEIDPINPERRRQIYSDVC